MRVFGNFPRYRERRFFFAGLGVGINLLGFLLVYSYGVPLDMGTLEGEIQWQLDVGRLAIMLATTAWWSGPLLLYVALAQSKLGSIVIGALSTLTLLWVWGDILTETSSTVGIGLLFWPPYLYGGIGLACALDAVLMRRAAGISSQGASGPHTQGGDSAEANQRADR